MRAWLMLLGAALLTACASPDHRAQEEAYRREQEAGGTLPWNRPERWEGAGAIGSQINPYLR